MIPVFDITRQNKIIGKELKIEMMKVMDKGIFILGEKVAEFEKEFADYLGVKYAVGVASGTDAISLALLAVGVGLGDEVVLPANSYPTAFAVTATGAIPRLVDIDPVTYNIDPTKISQAITKKTKAIIPVHLYGQPADMETILEIGKKSNIPVIEDCAQAHGAEIKIKNQKSKIKNTNEKLKKENSQDTPGVAASDADSPGVEESECRWRKVGTIEDVGCFSFYPTKNLGCFGDGGMVVTNNEEVYKRVKLLRMYGEERRYQSLVLGRNSRLDELQAAILLVKLKYLDKWNKRRREIARIYSDKQTCKGWPCKWPYEAPYTRHVYHLFVIRTKQRDQLKVYLEKKCIQTAIHYPKPIHLQPSFKYLGYKDGDFPQSETACKEILSLPIFPELTDREIEAVAKAISQFSAIA